MRAALIGAVESSRIALRNLAASPDWELAAVVTLPPELGHRHSDFVDLAPDAARAGVPLILAASTAADPLIDAVSALGIDYLFVIGWSQLCGERLLAVTPGRVVGYHPAALPRLRGRGVIPWTILLDEPITAGSLFLIDAGTDSGPILAQRFFHVAPDDTARLLYDKHMAALDAMLADLLPALAAGTVRAQPQDARYATWAARRRPEDGEIDWARPAADSWRLVRACGDPYPGARTALRDAQIVISAAEPVALDRHHAALAGQVIARDHASFTVRCGDGYGLHVTDWSWPSNGSPPLHARLGRPSGAPQ